VTAASGTSSDTGVLRRAVVKSPRSAVRDQADLTTEWQALGYLAEPDLQQAAAEHDGFVTLLEAAGVELLHLPAAPGAGPDSVYTHDPFVMTPAGAVLCRMGKAARAEEPHVVGRVLAAAGVPIAGRIEGDGQLEGGDVVWLDSATIAVGEGYRTNRSGIDQLAGVLRGAATVMPVPLPHWNGPGDCLHLMSLVSPIDRDLVVAYPRLLPVPFVQELDRRGITILDVPEREFASLGVNVLALAPRHCLMLEGNPVTRRRMESAGVTVQTFPGTDIAIKGCGGPTCLVGPVARDPVGTT